MSDWHENENGNYVLPMDDGVFTVFKDKSGSWRGIHDGQITRQGFGDADEAMSAVDDHLAGELLLDMSSLNTGWAKSQKGGYYRRSSNGIATVRQAKGGSWYIVAGGCLVKDKWFSDRQEAQRYADVLLCDP